MPRGLIIFFVLAAGWQSHQPAQYQIEHPLN